MNRLIMTAAVCAALASGLTHAGEAKPDHETSFNASAVSDYRYRGISQTRLRPALQGGADYVHNPTGLYAGTWLSTIKWIKDAGGGGNVEWDMYAGKRGEIAGGNGRFTYDVGALRYNYPSNDLTPSTNTTELYGQVGFGPAYLKYSRALTDLFGFSGSKGSGYLDTGANMDMGDGFTLNLHAGHQQVKGSVAGIGNDRFSYTDWKVGVTRDFGVVSGALAVVGTNADKALYTSPANGKFLGKNAITVAVSKTF